MNTTDKINLTAFVVVIALVAGLIVVPPIYLATKEKKKI